MRVKLVDTVMIRGGYFCAAYLPETKTIEINRYLPWWGQLNSLIHELFHLVNDLFLGNRWISIYLDFMWDVLSVLSELDFKGVSEMRRYYWKKNKILWRYLSKGYDK